MALCPNGGGCAVGARSGRRLGLGGYVIGTRARTGRPPPEGVHVDYPLRRADIPTSPQQVDGIAELWFDGRASMERALASPEMAALHADVTFFIGANKTFVVEEQVIIG
jgi:hypothetical protein